MKSRMRRGIASALNVMAHQEATRRGGLLAQEMRIRALELMDTGMPQDRVLAAVREDFGIEVPRAAG